MNLEVIKRNGNKVSFELNKIENAMKKAFESSNVIYNDEVITRLGLKVIAHISEDCEEKEIPIELIQDEVEKTLSENGFYKVAKNYILYRRNREVARERKSTVIDYKDKINDYLGSSDWRVKENSTVSTSLGGLILSNSGAMTANYWLSEIYDEEIGNAHKNADIHIHDLSMLSGYCFTGDTKIKTLDGKNYSFKELVDNNKKEVWIYAYDLVNKKIIPTKAINPRITRKTNKIIEITLDNGEKIKSTLDHLYLTRNGEYKKAEDLSIGESLMPLYVKNKGNYLAINAKWANKENLYIHRWVMENILNRPLEKDEVVHHIDGNKLNNSPENLEVKKDREHRRLEIIKTMNSDLWKEKNKERLCKFNKSKEKRKEVSDRALKRKRNNKGEFISTFSYNDKKENDLLFFNHKVIKSEIIILDKELEMYDLTVPNYENFALDSGVFVHNCAGWSLKQLIMEGLGGVEGRITSSPAAHLSTLCNQMVNFLGIMQNEWAGAQAFSSFDTYLAPFVKIDNLNYKQVKQCIQSFVYGVNTPSRWGTQAPFTNITLDWVVPNDLSELQALVGGKEMNFKYKDCQKEMDMVNKAFLEIMIEGDANGRGFQYPMNYVASSSDTCRK